MFHNKNPTAIQNWKAGVELIYIRISHKQYVCNDAKTMLLNLMRHEEKRTCSGETIPTVLDMALLKFKIRVIQSLLLVPLPELFCLPFCFGCYFPFLFDCHICGYQDIYLSQKELAITLYAFQSECD